MSNLIIQHYNKSFKKKPGGKLVSSMAEGNRLKTIPQIFAGNNGSSIVGITAITLIVAIDKICNSQYKISKREGDSELTFESAGKVWNEELSLQTIQENAVEKTAIDR